MGRNQPSVEYSLALKLSLDTSFYHILYFKSSLDSPFPFEAEFDNHGKQWYFQQIVFLFSLKYIIFAQYLDTQLDTCYNGINIKDRPKRRFTI